MAVRTLTSGSVTVPYMAMTMQPLDCPPPVLPEDFSNCRIPGGLELWSSGGFYSPGVCFAGYRAMCTQTSDESVAWPIGEGETVVKCVPWGYECNEPSKDQMFATTDFGGTVLSVPAFEIRWMSSDVDAATKNRPPPGVVTMTPPASLPTQSSTDEPTTMPSETTRESSTIDDLDQVPGTPLPTQPFPLPPGTIAGIAVGSALGLLALVLAIVYFAVRKRRRNRDNRPRLPEDEWDQGTYNQQGVPELGDTQSPVELDHKLTGPRELSAEPTGAPEGDVLASARGPADGHLNNASHISLNEIPIELAATPVQKRSTTKTEPAD